MILSINIVKERWIVYLCMLGKSKNRYTFFSFIIFVCCIPQRVRERSGDSDAIIIIFVAHIESLRRYKGDDNDLNRIKRNKKKWLFYSSLSLRYTFEKLLSDRNHHINIYYTFSSVNIEIMVKVSKQFGILLIVFLFITSLIESIAISLYIRNHFPCLAK